MMKKMIIFSIFIWIMFQANCLIAACDYYCSPQCVEYARNNSTALSDPRVPTTAPNYYARTLYSNATNDRKGNRPATGSAIIFGTTNLQAAGHVAIVSSITEDGLPTTGKISITLDHSNWDCNCGILTDDSWLFDLDNMTATRGNSTTEYSVIGFVYPTIDKQYKEEIEPVITDFVSLLHLWGYGYNGNYLPPETKYYFEEDGWGWWSDDFFMYKQMFGYNSIYGNTFDVPVYVAIYKEDTSQKFAVFYLPDLGGWFGWYTFEQLGL